MPEAGKIVTFYSFTAGIGRTMAVANLAWIMASNGLRVLAVDWDLETPGLHGFFRQYLTEEQMRSATGVVELVRTFVSESGEKLSAAERRTRIVQFAQTVRDAAIPLAYEFPGEGRIDFVPASKGPPFGETAGELDWNTFFGQRGAHFLSALRQVMVDTYDHTLIDARSGMADGTRRGTVVPPDSVVVCFAMTKQSIDGAATAAHLVDQHRGRRNIRILPVPMGRDNPDPDQADEMRRYAQDALEPFLKYDATQLGSHWSTVQVPYDEGRSNEEIAAATWQERGQPGGPLLAAYERLVGVITDGQVTQLPTQHDPGRDPAGGAGPSAPSATDALVSFASANLAWAEWVAAELDDAGLRVRAQPLDVGSGADETAVLMSAATASRRVLILLSEEYERSSLAREVFKLGAGGPAGSPRLVVVRLDATALPAQLGEVAPADLDALNEAESSTALRRAFELPPRNAGAPGLKVARRPRFPRTPPEVWNVSTRNPSFTGRGVLLDTLRQRFAEAGSGGPPQVLAGLGGVGKTQLALEFAHRFAVDYDVVWWISAETPELTRAELFNLAVRVGIVAGGATAVEQLLRALGEGRPYARWLLVYDNVESPHGVHELVPQGPGDVLITSRDPHWENVALIEPVDVFTRDESVAVLLGRRPDLSEEQARELAEQVGDLPLAVGAAAAFLAQTRATVGEYLERLEKQPGTLARTWLVSLTRLREQMPAAAKALEVLAFLGPEPIPLAVLSTPAVVAALAAFNARLRDPMMRGQVTNAIARLGLAQVDAGAATIEIHRLVQAAVRDQLSAKEARQTRDLAYEALAEANPRDPDLPDHRALYQALLPHLSCPDLLDMSHDGVRRLVVDMIRYRYKRGDYSGSEELCRQALHHWSEVHGLDDPFNLLVQYHRANDLRRMGRYEQAHALDEQTLAELRTKVGPDDPYTLMCAISLAADRRALGRYQEALELDLDTGPRFRDILGEDHERTLRFTSNLADSYRMVGDYAKAAEVDRDTYVRRLRVLTERHPYTQFSAQSYGRDLRDLGDLENSLRWLEKAWKAYCDIDGPDHPDTLRAAKNLAVTQRRLASFESAHQHALDTLDRYNRRLGSTHPETLVCALTLATTYAGRKDDYRARTIGKSVVDGMTRLLGADHPYTLMARSNLAVFELKLGHAADSIDGLKQVLDQLRAKLGESHPVTLMVALNLANHHAALGEHQDARWLDEDTYNRLTQRLGAEHPDAFAAAINLAIGQRACFEEEAATQRMSSALALARARLPEDHPRVVAARDWRRWVNTYTDPPPP